MKQASKRVIHLKSAAAAIAIGIGLFVFSMIVLGHFIGPSHVSSPNETKTTMHDSRLQKLKTIVGTDGAILVAHSATPVEASNTSQAPFKVVINYPNSLDCSIAKQASYDTFKDIFRSDDLEPLVDQVVISYPATISTSLVSEDSKNDGWWTGQTNFYNYMTSNYSVDENSGTRSTFVQMLTNCK